MLINFVPVVLPLLLRTLGIPLYITLAEVTEILSFKFSNLSGQHSVFQTVPFIHGENVRKSLHTVTVTFSQISNTIMKVIPWFFNFKGYNLTICEIPL